MLHSFLKHGIIVGVVIFLLSSMLIISELSTVRYLIAASDGYDLSITYVGKHVGTLIAAFVDVILSILLIWGMAKKRHMLLVPWLIFNFLVFVLITFTVFFDTISRDFNYIDDFIYCFVVVGFGIIVIYPIYILYIELHSLNMLNFTQSNIKY